MRYILSHFGMSAGIRTANGTTLLRRLHHVIAELNSQRDDWMGRCSEQILKYRSTRRKTHENATEQYRTEGMTLTRTEIKVCFSYSICKQFSLVFQHIGLTKLRKQTNQFHNRVKVFLIQVVLDLLRKKTLLFFVYMVVMYSMFVRTFLLKASHHSLSVNHSNG